jgi:hypothetical protein
LLTFIFVNRLQNYEIKAKNHLKRFNNSVLRIIN